MLFSFNGVRFCCHGSGCYKRLEWHLWMNCCCSLIGWRSPSITSSQRCRAKMKRLTSSLVSISFDCFMSIWRFPVIWSVFHFIYLIYVWLNDFFEYWILVSFFQWFCHEFVLVSLKYFVHLNFFIYSKKFFIRSSVHLNDFKFHLNYFEVSKHFNYFMFIWICYLIFFKIIWSCFWYLKNFSLLKA